MPIEQNKEDTEVPIEENKEKTEVPIEENEDETVEPNTSEEPNMSTPLTSEEQNMSTPLTSEEQNMSIPEVEHSEKTEALEREEYSEETPPTQEDLPDTQVVIEVLDEVSQNITDMNTIESQVMETQFNYLHERYVALTSIELTMTPVNSRLFLESKAYIAYKNEIDKNISNINNYFDVLIRKINELLPENTYLCDKVEAIKNKIISKYEELKSIKSISEGNFENKMQKIQDELQNFERLKDEL